MRVSPKLLFLPPAGPCDPGVPPYRLDLKQNYMCAIRRKLSIEKALSSQKCTRTRLRCMAVLLKFNIQFLNTLENYCIIIRNSLAL